MRNRSFKELNEERARAQLAQQMTHQTGSPAVSNVGYNRAMYDRMLTSEIHKAYNFSQRGPQETKYLADALTQGTGLTRYKSGDVKNFSFDTARQAQIDNANAISALQAMGVFDSGDYAYNKGYVHLPSDDYLKALLPEINTKIAEAQRLDAEYKARNDYRVNTWQLWSDFNNRKDSMQDEEKWAYADYLLKGDLSSPFSLDAYNDEWSEMDDDTFFAAQDALKSQYEGLDWGTLTDQNQIIADQLYESEVGKYQGYKNVIAGELDRSNELSALQASIRGDANYGTLSVYNDVSYTNTEPAFGDVNSMVNARAQDAYVKGYDDLNRFINSNAGWSAKMTAAEHDATVRDYMNKGYDYLTQQELADYNALYNAGRMEDAARYLELLSPELLYRRAMVLQEYQQVKATNPWLAVPTWVEAGLQQVANVFYLPQQVYEAAVGKDNPYSSAYDALNKSQWTTSAQVGAINNADIPDWADKVLTFAYMGVSGARDNAARLIAAGGNPTVALVLAGAQSASGSLRESSERSDMSGAAKIVKAIGTAAMEVGTEKIGLDALFAKGQKGALQYMKQVILSEVGEETLNAMSEPVMEAVVAFLFDHEAEIMSGPEFWQNLTDTAITTAISSVFLGGGSAISIEAGSRSVGQQVQNSGDLEGVLRIAESYSDKPYMADLTRSIREKQAKNMKVSARDIGKLTAEVSSAIGEERAQVVDQIADEAIIERLVELGETPQTARENASAIRKISRGGKLTLAERAAIDWNDNASQVLKEMATETTAEDAERTGHSWKTAANEKIQEATKAVTGKASQLAEAMTTKSSTAAAVGKAQDKAKAVTKGKPKLQQREMSFYEEGSGQTVTGAFERVVKKADEFVVEIKDAAGKTAQVSLDKISNTGSEGVLTIVNYAQDGTNHDMSAEEVNTMVNTYLHEGGEATSFVQQYEAAYLSGYSSIDAPASTLSEGVAAIAYEQGKAEAIKDEENRVVRARKARKVEKPVVGWLGDVTSDEQIKGPGDLTGLDAAVQKMTDSQQAMVEFGKHLAETAKINISFFASKAGKDGKLATQNGSYDPNTHTIYLDINSGAQTEDERKSMIKTGTLGDAIGRVAGHELTHVLEATSPEYYAKYKQAVKTALKASGKDYASLVRGKIDTALANGAKLTYDGAEAEVIADASEYMLQDSKFVKNMDQGLKGKVKEVIQNFLNKVNEAFRRMTGGHSESRALRTMTDGVYHYEKKLQDLWDMAFDEMLGAEVIKGDVADTLYETGEVYSYTAQNSLRVRDEKTIAYLENQKHITTYRAMQVIDGELYPPMAEFIGSKKDGNREDPGVLGRWEIAVEHPELIKWVNGKPKFELKKTNDDGSVSTVPAAYNPYMHSSNTVLNDQFSKAFQRTNLVVVECVVPVSESDGAYRAQYAKDATGWHEWKSGVVAGDLAKQKSGFRRDVFLSRYIKPVRILPDTEVAEKIAEYLDGTDVTVPFQSAWPTLRDALVQAGVKITEPRGLGAAQMKIATEAFEEWKRNAASEDIRYSIRDGLITTESTEQERYNILKDAVLKLAHVNTGRLEDVDLEAYNTRKKSSVEKGIRELARKLGITNVDLANSYIDFPFQFTNKNLGKSLHHQLDYGGTYQDYVKAMSCFDELVENAIPIETHPDKKLSTVKGNTDLKQVYVLVSAFKDSNRVVPVQFEIKEYRGNNGKLYMMVALTKITPEVVEAPGVRNAKVPAPLFSGDTISLRYLFENVNSSDYKFFKYVPDGFLSDEQKSAKARALADQAEEYASYGKDDDSSPDGIEIEAEETIQQSIRDLSPTINIRDILSSMTATSRMTETEKLLLKRYKETLATLAEKEKQVSEQEAIMRTATGDELIKARNRRNIYRSQANRAARSLAEAERNDGFARLMATSLDAANRFITGTSDNIADVTDTLEREIATLTAQLRQIEGDLTRTASGQKAAFARGLFDQKQLNTVAHGLKNTYGSRMSTKAIADRLALAYSEIYADGGADGARRFAEAAHNLAEDILRGNKFRYKSEILAMLSEQIGSISLTETDLQEIRNAGLTVREYKAMLAPYIKATDSGNDLSSYVSNAEYYGDGTLYSIFADGSEGDYAMRLYNTISAEKAKEADNGFEGRSESDLVMEIMADIAGSTLPLTDNSKTAAQLRNEILKYATENENAVRLVDNAIEKALSAGKTASHVWHAAVKDANAAKTAAEYYQKLEEQRRITELREQKEMLTDQLKSEAGKMLQETHEKYQQQISDIRLRRDINIEIGKHTRHIKRVVKKLNDRIIHEEDYKNVKEPLKPAVHKLVQTFIGGFGNMVFDQKTADRLRSVYDEIANDDAAPEFYSDDVANWLSELSDMKEWDALIRAEGSSSLGTAEEKLTAYSHVAEIADHIYKLVTAADEIFIDGKREKFNAFSNETGNALVEHKDAKLLVGKARDAYNAFQNLLVKGNLTPQYFFEHLKNSGMTRLFDGLMRGQTEYAQAIREGREAIAKAKEHYNFYSWKNLKKGVQFRTEQGHDIVLTVDQMMWVYATAKREATNKLMGTHHLDQGGFRYETKDLPKQKGKPWEAMPGSDLLHKLSAADVKKITDTLTAEQKACADELVSYLSNECAAQGNRASMELFGIKKYNEEYYFPFKTASDQRYQRSDAGSTSTTNDARVKHASFTHSLRKGANTPLVMSGFFDVIVDHINLMATYSSFVVPIESMNRVLNTKINEEADGSGNDVTIRSLIGKKYGEASQKYIADLLKDLNGGPQTDNRGAINALFRAFKRGAVMGSLSVSLQQPTAIVRAFAYVNPKYFAHITMEGNKKTWERMMLYSGTTVIKDMGKFDVGTGKMANDWIANGGVQEFNVWKRGKFLMDSEGWNATKNSWIEWMTQLPGVMDRVTWTHIWKAVEAEQADLNPGMDRNNDEFLRTVGKRFDDVINHTQVYDSVLAKSQNMRSKNPLTQMSTAFMSESTLNANMYYSAVTGEHTAGQRAGIVASVVVSNLLAAAMASLISAWNKDDDDRKITEKYLSAFASRAVDSLNPMTMYPYLSDLWSMASGYDIERTDLSVAKDLIDYTKSFISKARDPEKANTWRDYENFFGTIANLTGIPAKNISRDIRRIRNLFDTDKSASSPAAIKYTLLENTVPLDLYSDTNKAYCQRLIAAVADGDTQEAYNLWDYLTNSKKASTNSLNTNIRDELKRLVQAGEITTAMAAKILAKYAPYKDPKDNTKKPIEWLNGK